MRATARADNPTEDITPTEEDSIDGTADVGTETAYAGDVEDSKTTITPTDGGEALELMMVQDRNSVSTDTSTVASIVTVCIHVRNVSHRQLDTSPMQPLEICLLDLPANVCETKRWHRIDL